MADVQLTVEPATARFYLRIDGSPVKLINGKGSKTVAGGREHALQYFTLGAPGTKYTVAVAAPPEAKGTWGATFDANGQDANQVWFWTD